MPEREILEHIQNPEDADGETRILQSRFTAVKKQFQFGLEQIDPRLCFFAPGY